MQEKYFDNREKTKSTRIMNKNLFSCGWLCIMMMIALLATAQTDVFGDSDTLCSDLPANFLYNYSYSQQRYTPAELGGASTITGITFYVETNQCTDINRSWHIFLAKEGFRPVPTLVYAGEVTIPSYRREINIHFTQPYQYNGEANLILTIYDNSGVSNEGYFFYSSTNHKAPSFFSHSDNPLLEQFPTDSVYSCSSIRLLTDNHTPVHLTAKTPFTEDFDGTLRSIDSLWRTNNAPGAHWIYEKKIPMTDLVGTSKSAIFYYHNNANRQGSLISPLVIGRRSSMTVRFSYEVVPWLPTYDTLTVCYRTDTNQTQWDTLLTTTDTRELISTDSLTGRTHWRYWRDTSFTLPLQQIQLRFSVSTHYGFGVAIDSISITDTGAEDMYCNIDGDLFGTPGDTLTFYADATQEATLFWSLTGSSHATDNRRIVRATWDSVGTYTVVCAATRDSETVYDTLLVTIYDCHTPLQLPFSCGFEKTDNDNCWTFFSTDSDDKNWHWFQSPEYAHSGHGAMTSHTAPRRLDNWAVLPQVHIPADGALLEWYTMKEIDDHNEHYYVAVSTTGTDPADFSEVVLTDTLTGPGKTWVRHRCALNYSDQDVFIAFRHFKFSDSFRIYIDDITIRSLDTTGIHMAEVPIVNVHPNPCQGTFYVTSDTPVRQVEVYTTHGVRVRIEADNKIDLSVLPQGIYLLRITLSDGTTALRHIILQ